MKYRLNQFNSYCADFELGYPGYRIESIIGQKINCHFPEMEWNKIGIALYESLRIKAIQISASPEA